MVITAKSGDARKIKEYIYITNLQNLKSITGDLKEM